MPSAKARHILVATEEACNDIKTKIEHGSEQLMPLYVADDSERAALAAEAKNLTAITVSSAAAANAVMLGGGYFTPLTGYMNLADSLAVAENLHTADGLFWPVPIVNLNKDIKGDRLRRMYGVDSDFKMIFEAHIYIVPWIC